MDSLAEKKCKPCEVGAKTLAQEQVQQQLKHVPSWRLTADNTRITREFPFKGFYKTMAFVNAVAWIANTEGHHPDMEVSYNQCIVHFSTHAANGLTENDFICAAKVDRLVDGVN